MTEDILNKIKLFDRSNLTELIFKIQELLDQNDIQMYGFRLSRSKDNVTELIIKQFGYITRYYGDEVSTSLINNTYVLNMITGDIEIN